MGIFSWFSKGSKPDYETLLAQLSSQIDESRVHLSEIRLRERRWSLLINLYGIALWAVLVGLWWTRTLPLGLLGWRSDGTEAKIIGAAIVGAAPVLLYGLNRGLHFVFTKLRNSSEKHLRELLAEQRKHLEAIKKATNYDSTRKLIERYDESTTPSPGTSMGMGLGPVARGPRTPQRGTPDTPTPPGKSGPKGTPRAPGHLTGAGGTPAPGPTTPIPIPEGLAPDQAAALQLQMQTIQPVLPTPEKKWYDRVVDSILGDDPSQAAHSKYALVCGECFRHNGLVGGKYEWERMQWICPRCNHMNPAPLTRLKESDAHSTPQSTPMHQREHSSPAAAPRLSRNSPRPKRSFMAERSTPGSSRLGKEVFSASDDEQKEDEGMDVDEK
ncbi:hypothetical protein DB88DRAFT_524678 [Papiliotrema laurentii]|uniref:Endoplasmic reticulum junction formation protein lunapark n=1 Tax=Papiliotrema laurentii TaxID=5418 RepID=A0AAD9L6R3_PAPLA|nr:hypothetical protein DB88DRAFT_524678 [Papiliotrema laurentii]